MSDIDITLSKDHLENQKQRLTEELDYSQEEAQTIYQELKDNVRKEIDDQGKDWGNDCVEAMTNLMIAVQIQTKEQVDGEIPDQFDVFQGITAQLTERN